jgi:hypothetical protein
MKKLKVKNRESSLKKIKIYIKALKFKDKTKHLALAQ